MPYQRFIWLTAALLAFTLMQSSSRSLGAMGVKRLGCITSREDFLRKKSVVTGANPYSADPLHLPPLEPARSASGAQKVGATMRPLRFLTRAATAGALASALALTPLVPALAETAADPRLVLRYNLDQTSGTVAVDTSGNGRNGELVNGGTWAGSEGLKLDGVNDHVRLPNNIMQGLSAITVSTDVLIAPTQATPYFIYGLGNTSSGIGNGYLFTTGDGYRTSIASGNWSTEQTLSQNQPLARGVWKTITYTLTNGTATLFLDGLQVGQKTGVTITPGSIGNGLTTANYLGRSDRKSTRLNSSHK
jgi:hypothetical protein